MTKQKAIKGFSVGKNGRISINACCDEANSDPIRAGRLARAAKAGDNEAAEELARMSATPMMQEVEDE